MAARDGYISHNESYGLMTITSVEDVLLKLAVRFTATASYTATHVKLPLFRVGSPGTITVKLCADSGGSPQAPGAELASGTCAGNALTDNTAGEWATFDLGAGASLTAGTVYWLIIDSLGTGLVDVDMVGWRFDAWPSGDSDATSKVYDKKYGSYVWSSTTADFLWQVWDGESGSGPSKPTTPSPANGATDVDFSDLTLSWANGGGATSYDVYVGSSGSLSCISEGQTGTTCAVTMDQVPVNQVIYWRVDAVNDDGTATGDVWHFDARPAKASSPTPADEATGQSIYVGASWSGSSIADSYDLYIAPHEESYTLAATELTAEEVEQIFTYYHLGHNAGYDWRVDSRNSFGITQGDTWTFSTAALVPPSASWELIPGGSGNGPWDTPPGVEDVDFRWVGDNRTVTTKRIVVAAMNRIWFEDV